MSLIIALILGGLVGWIAAAIMGRDEGIFASIAIGVVGSVLGSFLSTIFTGSDRAMLAFTWGGLVWSLIGAVLLVAILNAFQGSRRHNVGRM